MIVSLNEIAATAAKAVRGCGHPEGLAEEAGFAVRWLCQRELPGIPLLLAALGEGAPADVELIEGSGRRIVRTAGGRGPVSVLRVGASLVELSTARPGPPDDSPLRPVAVESLTHPLLLVPFVARDRSGRVTARWSTADGPVVVEPADGPVVVEPAADGIRIRAASHAALGASLGGDVVVGRGVVHSGRQVGSVRPEDQLPIFQGPADLEAASQRSIVNGCTVDDVEWAQLGELAGRSYVPVSEESRLRGAGAGLTDND